MATATRADNLENLGSIDSLQSMDQPGNDSSSIGQRNGSSSPTSPTRSLSKITWSRCINSEIGRFISSIIYFVVVCIAMAFCNQFSDHRWVETDYTNIILRDRGFDIFPARRDITPANTFVMTSIVFTLIGIAFICPNWTERIIVLRRVFWVVGTLSVYRALTLSVTTLPTPKEGCIPATERGFKDMFWIALEMIPGTVEACTDDIFSGHTVFMVTCAIQWRLYCRNKWATYFSYAYITVGLYFVIATRLHYTVDVVLAIFITYAAWSLYIAMIDVVMEKEYFGLKRHHDKYMIFDSRWSQEQDQEQRSRTGEEDPEKGLAVNSSEQQSTASVFAAKRAQLEHRMNRMRGPGMGYDRGEHDRVAFVPMQYNIWLIGAIRWCDGLDLRMCQSSMGSAGSRWEELVVDRRSRHVQDFEQSFPHQKSVSSNAEHVGHDRQATVAPVMLDSIHVISPTDEASTAAGTK
ncbi:hypothetical protein EDD21DRAFT_3865 [Dissophora ornata]|nr:hypothetical protein EDD21DRAFT_3865 [Dissophora ornata]